MPRIQSFWTQRLHLGTCIGDFNSIFWQKHFAQSVSEANMKVWDLDKSQFWLDIGTR